MRCTASTPAAPSTGAIEGRSSRRSPPRSCSRRGRSAGPRPHRRGRPRSGAGNRRGGRARSWPPRPHLPVGDDIAQSTSADHLRLNCLRLVRALRPTDRTAHCRRTGWPTISESRPACRSRRAGRVPTASAPRAADRAGRSPLRPGARWARDRRPRGSCRPPREGTDRARSRDSARPRPGSAARGPGAGAPRACEPAPTAAWRPRND